MNAALIVLHAAANQAGAGNRCQSMDAVTVLDGCFNASALCVTMFCPPCRWMASSGWPPCCSRWRRKATEALQLSEPASSNSSERSCSGWCLKLPRSPRTPARRPSGEYCCVAVLQRIVIKFLCLLRSCDLFCVSYVLHDP